MNKDNEKNIRKLECLCNKFNLQNVRHLFIGNGDDRFEFEVKHRLGIDDVRTLVTEVCNSVVNPDTGDYYPELKDYYLRKAVLKAYTDISLPEDERCWDIVYGTQIFAMVTGHDMRPVTFGGREYDDNMSIDVEQYEGIIKAIDQRIELAVRLYSPSFLMIS